MADGGTEAERRVERRRAQLEQPIALRFEYFGDFIQELSANISLGGMFIRTSKPRPRGSRFDFEFKLGEDFTLIRGRGEVVWRRPTADGPDRPAGMGVRFLELDDTSRRVIEQMLEQGGDSGRHRFDLEEDAPQRAVVERGDAAPEELDRAAESAAMERPEAGEPDHDERQRRGRPVEAADLEAARAELELLRRETEASEAEARQAEDRLQAALAAAEEGRDEAARRLADVEKKRAEDRRRLQELEAARDDLNAEAEETRASLTEVGAVRKQLEQELAEARRQIEGIRAESERATAELGKRLEKAEANEGALRGRLEEAQAELHGERREAARLSERTDIAEGELAGLRGEMLELQASLVDAEDGRRRAESSLDRTQSEAEGLRRRTGEPAVVAPVGPDGDTDVVEPAAAPRTGRTVAAAAVGVLVGALLSFLVWGRGAPSSERAAEVPVRLAETAPVPAPVPEGEPQLPPDAVVEADRQAESETAGAAVPDTAAGSVEPAAAPDAQAAREAVVGWAGAWSEQRIDDYLSYYSSSFRPARNLPRRVWEAQRRDRLARPKFIRVTVSAAELETLAPDRVRYRFIQRYESDTFTDEVPKVLELVWEQGSWKIVAERAG